MDTISADIGTTRIICAIEGLKCDSLVPTKYHYVCASSDDVKVQFTFINLLNSEKIHIVNNNITTYIELVALH